LEDEQVGMTGAGVAGAEIQISHLTPVKFGGQMQIAYGE